MCWTRIHLTGHKTFGDKLVRSQSYTYQDRRSVGQSVLLSGSHLGPVNNFSPSFYNYFEQLRICWSGAPSLTRSRVCSFQFLLGIASASATFLKSESHGTHEHILLSLFLKLPQSGGWEGGKLKSKSRSHYDRHMSRPVRLGVSAHLGPATNFAISLRFSFKTVTVCYVVAPSLTRGRVCNLL
jgi:hypothetical protein